MQRWLRLSEASGGKYRSAIFAFLLLKVHTFGGVFRLVSSFGSMTTAAVRETVEEKEGSRPYAEIKRKTGTLGEDGKKLLIPLIGLKNLQLCNRSLG